MTGRTAQEKRADMRIGAFTSALRKREPLAGTFVKTASYQIPELLGRSGLDFIIIDAEHAPFDRNLLDVMILGARAVDLPSLVRIPNSNPDTILAVLDMGANGILVPHVTSAVVAGEIVASARYRGGKRGFSGSPRFADYGALTLPEALARGDGMAAVLCQIEDREGVERVEEIAAVPGVDGLFVGRADLALALGETRLDSAAVEAASTRVLHCAGAAGKTAAIFLPGTAELGKFRDRGATMFVIGSDQSLLQQAARNVADGFAQPPR
jgi:2-keto-3-deoxy-L-rhamnonate aldolase RhmA